MTKSESMPKLERSAFVIRASNLFRASSFESVNILIVGIGNIFFGDDVFGCEIAAQLMKRALPKVCG